MIWNKDYLFIHVPKTAGMSMTQTFLNGLEGQITYAGPHERKKIDNIMYVPGKRHETLIDAESYFTYTNQSIFDFKKIFVVMRSPYDLEISRYAYLRKNLETDRGLAQEIALSSSFKEYLKAAPFFGQNPPRLDKYYQIGNSIPPNLVVLKYESLESEIRWKLAPHLKKIDLGRENSSERKLVSEIFNPETEVLCFNRHKWFFEKGFYQRIDFDK